MCMQTEGCKPNVWRNGGGGRRLELKYIHVHKILAKVQEGKTILRGRPGELPPEASNILKQPAVDSCCGRAMHLLITVRQQWIES